MITAPYTFENISIMRAWHSSFEAQAIEICRTHNAMEVWDTIKLLYDENNLQLAIVSIGAWVINSDQDTASDKIIELFNSMFGESTFLL